MHVAGGATRSSAGVVVARAELAVKRAAPVADHSRMIRVVDLPAMVLALLCLAGCATTVPHAREAPVVRAAESDEADAQTGLATYYARRFAGRRTASGERYDPDALTGAHRTLAFGTRVRVTNLTNRRTVVVVITDRGPFDRRRVIDLSRRAARELGMLRDGVARVRLEPLAASL
jgi:rare lipoprotein A